MAIFRYIPWLLPAAFCCFLSARVTAQQTGGQVFSGLTIAQVTGDDLGGFDKAGFVAGAAATLPLASKFFLQPEIFYIQKGSKSRRNEPYFLWRLSYISMPLLLSYRPDNRFFLLAGLSADYLLKASTDNGNGLADRSDDFNNFDFCLQAGASYNFYGPLSLNLRFSNSLTGITSQGDDFYNRTLSLTLSYHLAMP